VPAQETLNPLITADGELNIGRRFCLYERLVTQKASGGVANQLAAELSPNKKADVWKIKLRDDVLWHDGTPLVADDIVYTLRYIITRKMEGASVLSGVLRPSGIRRLDRKTVQLTLEHPNAILPLTLSDRTLLIIKNGTTSFRHPIGTGPWKFVNWTKGQRSLFARNQHYRVHGGPYLSELEFITVVDPTARLNALASGQVDVIAELDPKQRSVAQANKSLRVLSHPSGSYVTQTMWVDTPPFDDKRVRQALRLLVNRQQMVSNALGGLGIVGNDLQNHGDAYPEYVTLKEIPQRPYDPEQAKSLLHAAGADNLKITLATGDAAIGMLESSTLLAQQAKAAGVTISLNVAPGDQYYNTLYGKQPFACSGWGTRFLDSYIAASLVPNCPFPETHWNRPDFTKLWLQARGTVDQSKAHDLWLHLQQMLWNEGGDIIWGFNDYLDAYSAKVKGLQGSVARNLGSYDFTNAYFG
jgi:peptide/nickel transport system substrate-binding protein